MNRLILLVLVVSCILGIHSSSVLAQEEQIPLTATASSTHYLFEPQRAVDGDDSTFWIGGRNQAPWWIMFDAGALKQFARIEIKWYNQNLAPANYDIQTSADAETWQDIYTGIEGVYQPAGESREINQQARYLRFTIHSLYADFADFPALIEMSAYTQIELPRLLRFQGRLANPEGVSLEGSFTLTFRLYDTETDGQPLWEELQQEVEVVDGLLDVELGSHSPLDLAFNQQYWLGVEVEADGEMLPRFKLTSVPYAISAE